MSATLSSSEEVSSHIEDTLGRGTPETTMSLGDMGFNSCIKCVYNATNQRSVVIAMQNYIRDPEIVQ